MPGLRQYPDRRRRGRAALLRPAAGAPKAPARRRGHAITVQEVEEDWYATFSHPMEKGHYLRFAAWAGLDRMMLCRLYPEQGGEFRLPQLRGGGKLYVCCSRDGLFEVTP